MNKHLIPSNYNQLSFPIDDSENDYVTLTFYGKKPNKTHNLSITGTDVTMAIKIDGNDTQPILECANSLEIQITNKQIAKHCIEFINTFKPTHIRAQLKNQESWLIVGQSKCYSVSNPDTEMAIYFIEIQSQFHKNRPVIPVPDFKLKPLILSRSKQPIGGKDRPTLSRAWESNSAMHFYKD